MVQAGGAPEVQQVPSLTTMVGLRALDPEPHLKGLSPLSDGRQTKMDFRYTPKGSGSGVRFRARREQLKRVVRTFVPGTSYTYTSPGRGRTCMPKSDLAISSASHLLSVPTYTYMQCQPSLNIRICTAGP